jgi:hypothetical protein
MLYVWFAFFIIVFFTLCLSSKISSKPKLIFQKSLPTKLAIIPRSKHNTHSDIFLRNIKWFTDYSKYMKTGFQWRHCTTIQCSVGGCLEGHLALSTVAAARLVRVQRKLECLKMSQMGWARRLPD